MNRILSKAAVGVLLALGLAAALWAEPSDSMRLAMEQEMQRTMEELSLGDLKRPCFAGFTLSRARTLQITASLGAIVRSDLSPQDRARVRLLVGSHKMSNENYMFSGNWTQSDDIPRDDSRRGIRQVLWRIVDGRYKEHAEELEKKLAAIAQQNLAPEDTSLPDLAPASPLTYERTAARVEWEPAYWQDLARRLSAIFLDYPQIQASQVSLYAYQAEVCYLNSEGTWARYPVRVSAVVAEARVQAADGRDIEDRIEFFFQTPSGLAGEASMAQRIREMAATLIALRSAPLFEDSYSGPVMFEGQALAELLAQRLFSDQTGLKAKRKNILDPSYSRYRTRQALENPLEARLGKKVLWRGLSIKDVPGLEEMDGQSLIGSYEVDAEGVRPPEELVLVEKGVLKNLLNGRTPTRRVPQSNGHKRLELTANGLAEEIGPGVVVVTAHKSEPYERLKRRLIKAARSEDLDYAYIVKKMGRATGGSNRDQEASLGEPVVVVQVSVKDGSERLVRGAEITGFSLNALKRVLGAAKEPYIYNTMLGADSWRQSWGWGLCGVPTTLVVPGALILEEVDMAQERRAVTAKLPAVTNPLEE